MVAGSGPSPRHRADLRDHARYVAIRHDERFAALKRKTRRLAILTAVLFPGWYLLYVVAAEFARRVMTYRLLGVLNVAVVSGLLQFAVAFVIAWRHGRYCREVLDPLAAQIVGDAERSVRWGARRRLTAAGQGGALVLSRGPGGEGSR